MTKINNTTCAAKIAGMPHINFRCWVLWWINRMAAYMPTEPPRAETQRSVGLRHAPAMPLRRTFVVDGECNANQIDGEQIDQKDFHGFPPKKAPHWGQYRLFASTLQPQCGQQRRPLCRRKDNAVGSACAWGSRSRRRPSSFESA